MGKLDRLMKSQIAPFIQLQEEDPLWWGAETWPDYESWVYGMVAAATQQNGWHLHQSSRSPKRCGRHHRLLQDEGAIPEFEADPGDEYDDEDPKYPRHYWACEACWDEAMAYTLVLRDRWLRAGRSIPSLERTARGDNNGMPEYRLVDGVSLPFD